MKKFINNRTIKRNLILLVAIVLCTALTYPSVYAWFTVNTDSGGQSAKVQAGAIKGDYTIDYSIIGIPGEGFEASNELANSEGKPIPNIDLYEHPEYSYLKVVITVKNTGTSPDYGPFVYKLNFNLPSTTTGIPPDTTIEGTDGSNSEYVGKVNATTLSGIIIDHSGTSLVFYPATDQYGVLSPSSSKTITLYIPLIKFYGRDVIESTLNYDGNKTMGYNFANDLFQISGGKITGGYFKDNPPITIKWCQYKQEAFDDVFPEAAPLSINITALT